MADGSYWLSHDAQDIDDTIDEVQAARGSEASLSARLADIVSDFEADQQRQETEIGAVAALGAKNLFNTSATDDTRDTVTFAVNGDGTINITTSAATTSSSNAYVIGTYIPEKTGQYTVSTGLSSAATGGSTSTTFCVQLRQGASSSGTLIARIGSDPATLTLTAGETYALRFYFLSGQTINEICKPMIRPAEITDASFVPYAPTNRELYEMILALQSGAAVQSAPASLMQAGRIEAELTDAKNDEAEVEER